MAPKVMLAGMIKRFHSEFGEEADGFFGAAEFEEKGLTHDRNGDELGDPGDDFGGWANHGGAWENRVNRVW
jgi:hypothetical protein